MPVCTSLINHDSVCAEPDIISHITAAEPLTGAVDVILSNTTAPLVSHVMMMRSVTAPTNEVIILLPAVIGDLCDVLEKLQDVTDCLAWSWGYTNLP